MKSSDFNFDRLEDVSTAINYLAQKLNSGHLSLFLGSGSSAYYKFPSWLELVNHLRVSKGLTVITAADDFQGAADEAIEKCRDDDEVMDLIEGVLYNNNSFELDTSSILGNKLLVSLSAILSRGKKGSIDSVITLNYDSLIEWYMSLMGFTVETVHTLPSTIGNADLTVYHPHGYIPSPKYSSKRGQGLILGLDSANLRLAKEDDDVSWIDFMTNKIYSKVMIFIGMSLDSLNDRVLAECFVKSAKYLHNDRPTGIWISFSPLNSSQVERFRKNNIVVLQLCSTDLICDFLLGICNKARINVV